MTGALPRLIVCSSPALVQRHDAALRIGNENPDPEG
jgi:hypothetical protein